MSGKKASLAEHRDMEQNEVLVIQGEVTCDLLHHLSTHRSVGPGGITLGQACPTRGPQPTRGPAQPILWPPPTPHHHGSSSAPPTGMTWSQACTHSSVTTSVSYQRCLGSNQGTGRAQVTANSCLYFDTLVKHSPENREKYATVLSILIQEFENRFQDC